MSYFDNRVTSPVIPAPHKRPLKPGLLPFIWPTHKRSLKSELVPFICPTQAIFEVLVTSLYLSYTSDLWNLSYFPLFVPHNRSLKHELQSIFEIRVTPLYLSRTIPHNRSLKYELLPFICPTQSIFEIWVTPLYLSHTIDLWHLSYPPLSPLLANFEPNSN